MTQVETRDLPDLNSSDISTPDPLDATSPRVDIN